jgi:DNA-binding CsgD family transcriptional regulator
MSNKIEILLLGFDLLFLDICRELISKCPLLNPQINHLINTNELFLTLKYNPEFIIVELSKYENVNMRITNFLSKNFKNVYKLCINNHEPTYSSCAHYNKVLERNNCARDLLNDIFIYTQINVNNKDSCSIYLTEREKQISALILAGKTNRNIANNLNISPKTVDVHKQNIFKKIGSSNMAVILPKLKQEILI